MSSSSRQSAISLYRRILRIANTWKCGNKPVEVDWIRRTARETFETKRSVSLDSEIRDLIAKGHQTVDVAVHYQIPYPRLHYADPNSIPEEESDLRSSSSRKRAKTEKKTKLKTKGNFKFKKWGPV